MVEASSGGSDELPPRERRATVRVHFRVRVTLGVAKADNAYRDPLDGQVLNLSTGGLYVRCERPFPAGAPCVVSFSVHDNGSTHNLTIPSRVAHSHQDGMGIEFVELDGRTKALLSRQVNRILYEHNHGPAD